MKFSTILVLVLVICVVALEAKPDSAKKAARKARRRNRNEQCTKQVEFSACDTTSNTMNKTITSCKTNKVKTSSMSCTMTKNFTVKEGCSVEMVYDYSACGDVNENARNMTLSVTVSDGCATHGLSNHTESTKCGAKAKKAFKILKGIKKMKKAEKKAMKKQDKNLGKKKGQRRNKARKARKEMKLENAN